MTAPGRLVIVDAGLTGWAGHHLTYSAAVAGAARARGLGAVILANRAYAGPPDVEGTPIRPLLGTAYQTQGGGGAARRLAFGLAAHLPAPLAGLVGPPLRALRRAIRGGGRVDRLGEELAAAGAELNLGPADSLLLHSVSGANLASIATGPALGGAALLVVLRRMPAEMEADDPAPEPFPDLLRLLAGRFGPALRLFADTVPLADDFARLSGLPVRPVPLPIVVAARPEGEPSGLPHVVFAGGARLEKGYQFLPEAVAAVAGRARFTIQSGQVGPHSDPLVQRAHRRLRGMAGDRLVLVEQALDPAPYAALLASADLLLLPYDGPTYGARSSGILAESLAMGVPAVVPAGCWMDQVAGPDRVVAVPHEAPLAPALAEALDRLPALTAACRAAAPAWRAWHNPDSLLRALLAPA